MTEDSRTKCRCAKCERLVGLGGEECRASLPVPQEDVTDEMVERGRRAINEQVTEAELQHAKEGKPFAEEEIARVVLVAALSRSPRTLGDVG